MTKPKEKLASMKMVVQNDQQTQKTQGAAIMVKSNFLCKSQA